MAGTTTSWEHSDTTNFCPRPKKAVTSLQLEVNEAKHEAAIVDTSTCWNDKKACREEMSRSSAADSGQEDEKKPAPAASAHKNDPCSTDRRRGILRLHFRRRGRSNSTRSLPSVDQTSSSWHPPLGYSVPPPSVRLRSSMTVTSLDDSLSHRGLSRSRRRAQKQRGDAHQLPSDEEDLSVSFGKIQIRQYERIPGDNPSICFGVPLAIGWAFNEEGVPISVEEYESQRSSEPKKRDEMYVSLRERERILTEDWGISRSAVRAAEKSVSLASKQRRATSERLHLEPAQEAIESARKKFDRVVYGKSDKKEEERLWREAQKRTVSNAPPSCQNVTAEAHHPTRSAIVATEPDDADDKTSSPSRVDRMFDNRYASGRNLKYRDDSSSSL